MQVVKRECRLCAQVGARGDRRRRSSTATGRRPRSKCQGHTPNMVEAMKFDINSGRYFTETEYDQSAPVAVIGWDVQDELFSNVDPIGRTIKVDGYPVRVIGTLAKQGAGHGSEPGQRLLHPADALPQAHRAGSGHRHLRQAEGRRRGRSEPRRRGPHDPRSLRRTGYKDDDPFASSPRSCSRRSGAPISAGLFLLMTFISGISLVVGAIVIANIMFVSVVRAHEGDRRAPRARRPAQGHPPAVPPRGGAFVRRGRVIGVIVDPHRAGGQAGVPGGGEALVHPSGHRRRDGRGHSRGLDPLEPGEQAAAGGSAQI
jgi:putative ABC transport system permease protein